MKERRKQTISGLREYYNQNKTIDLINSRNLTTTHIVRVDQKTRTKTSSFHNCLRFYDLPQQIQIQSPNDNQGYQNDIYHNFEIGQKGGKHLRHQRLGLQALDLTLKQSQITQRNQTNKTFTFKIFQQTEQIKKLQRQIDNKEIQFNSCNNRQSEINNANEQLDFYQGILSEVIKLCKPNYEELTNILTRVNEGIQNSHQLFKQKITLLTQEMNEKQQESQHKYELLMGEFSKFKSENNIEKIFESTLSEEKRTMILKDIQEYLEITPVSYPISNSFEYARFSGCTDQLNSIHQELQNILKYSQVNQNMFVEKPLTVNSYYSELNNKLSKNYNFAVNETAKKTLARLLALYEKPKYDQECQTTSFNEIIEEFEQQVRVYQAKLNKKEQESTLIEYNIQMMTKKLEKLTKERDNVEQQYKELTQEYDENKDILQQIQREREFMNNQMKMLKKKNNMMLEQLQERDKDINLQNQQIQKLEKKIEKQRKIIKKERQIKTEDQVSQSNENKSEKQNNIIQESLESGDEEDKLQLNLSLNQTPKTSKDQDILSVRNSKRSLNSKDIIKAPMNEKRLSHFQNQNQKNDQSIALQQSQQKQRIKSKDSESTQQNIKVQKSESIKKKQSIVKSRLSKFSDNRITNDQCNQSPLDKVNQDRANDFTISLEKQNQSYNTNSPSSINFNNTQVVEVKSIKAVKTRQKSMDTQCSKPIHKQVNFNNERLKFNEVIQTDNEMFTIYIADLFQNELESAIKQELQDEEDEKLFEVVKKFKHLIDKIKFRAIHGDFPLKPMKNQHMAGNGNYKTDIDEQNVPKSKHFTVKDQETEQNNKLERSKEEQQQLNEFFNKVVVKYNVGGSPNKNQKYQYAQPQRQINLEKISSSDYL